LVVLLASLALPALALAKLPIDLRLSGTYALAVSLIAYVVNGHDKARAEAHGWRVPEATLHLLELIGGWPGAFIAQRRLRHKISKMSYQAGFWAIVLLYQAAAYDSLQQWRFTHALMRTFAVQSAR
jgi:uncharacterized membrane protein YsdA (DUF1294 family)